MSTKEGVYVIVQSITVKQEDRPLCFANNRFYPVQPMKAAVSGLREDSFGFLTVGVHSLEKPVYILLALPCPGKEVLCCIPRCSLMYFLQEQFKLPHADT